MRHRSMRSVATSPNKSTSDKASKSATTQPPTKRTRSVGTSSVARKKSRQAKPDDADGTDGTDGTDEPDVPDVPDLVPLSEEQLEQAQEIRDLFADGAKMQYIPEDQALLLKLGLAKLLRRQIFMKADLDLLKPVTLPNSNTASTGSKWRRAFNEMLSDFLSSLRSKSRVDATTIGPELDPVQERESAVRKAAEGRAPSTAARTSTIAVEQKQRPILNGRPLERAGPSIAIYHDVFSTFRTRISNPNFRPDVAHMEDTLELLNLNSQFYEKERDRQAAIQAKLSAILGPVEGPPDYLQWKSDGVMMTRTGNHEIPYMVLEVKNEIGSTGCDPVFQCACWYRKLWSTERMRRIRNACCCPCFLVSIVGPWITVHGAILAERFVVQRLSPMLEYGGSENPEEDHLEIAKILAALKEGLAELTKYYEHLKPLDTCSLSEFSPTFKTYKDENGETFKLTYSSANLLPGRMGRAMFDASLNKTKDLVKVKFTRRYSKEAHKLLACQGLAPSLRYCETRDDGWTIVVMDRISGTDLASSKLRTPFPIKVTQDIRKALDILKENGLVFGDLRPPNVMIYKDGNKKERAMLVDFDWAGKAGQTYYPYGLNPEVSWAKGAKGGTLIQMEHDEQMRRLLMEGHNM